MTLILFDGYFFEDHINAKTKNNMPASTAAFKEYSIIINMPKDSLVEDGKLQSKGMKSLSQLNAIIPELEIEYTEYITGRAKKFFINTDAKKLHPYKEKEINKKLMSSVLDNFEMATRLRIINSSITKNRIALDIIKNQKGVFKYKRKKLNVYETEYYNRIAFSLSCLILFFIGAPLGSIIRKGGFGLPMILAICIYVLYFFTNTFGRNLAEDSTVSTIIGSWIAAIVMIPFGILLTFRATKDKGLFNIDSLLQPITQLIKKISSKKDNKNNGE
jgi:lipopolysaccharide export system permease protein